MHIDALFVNRISPKNGGHDQPLSRTPRKKDIFIITTVKHLSNLRGPFLKFIFVRKILRILGIKMGVNYLFYFAEYLRFILLSFGIRALAEDDLLAVRFHHAQAGVATINAVPLLYTRGLVRIRT